MTVGESLVRAWVNALGPTLNVCFWPSTALGACTDLVAIGCRADAANARSNRRL